MKKFLVSLLRSAEICSLLVLSCALCSAQATVNDLALSPSPFSGPAVVAPEPATVDILSGFPPEPMPQQSSEKNTQQSHGFIVRNLRRGLEDQKQLYLAPFKPKNLKWDALFLATTGGLLAIDRQASREVTQDHVDISHQVALASLLATSAAAGGTWLYGLKADNAHAKETGQLELETLANTFLIYTPMQFIAGRERPDEATGNGRFWRHGGFNTSFPAGHPMFTWAMASVLAHEYPRPWVKILVYGAALSVSVGRFTGRNHFPSDIFVGSALGYLIGTHIFHARCDPGFSEACHRNR